MGELLSLSSFPVIWSDAQPTTCQKCQHPTSCEGHTCGHIMGNNIQPCDQLTPCHLTEGKAVGTLEKTIAKKKVTEKLIQPATHFLYSHLQKHFQVTLPPTNGQLKVCPSRECLGHVFVIMWLSFSNVINFGKKPLAHQKFQLHSERSRLSFHLYRFARHDAWFPCALGVYCKGVQNQNQDIGN